MATVPTREEWKALVAEHGYRRAVRIANCDLDDIPGIEETWLENMEAMMPQFEKSQRDFLEWLKRQEKDEPNRPI